jgi:hypothetical protein
MYESLKTLCSSHTWWSIPEQRSGTTFSRTPMPSSGSIADWATRWCYRTARWQRRLRLCQRWLGRWHKIMQSGPTVVEDDVEVQVNACIDRASVGETRVGHALKSTILFKIWFAGRERILCARKSACRFDGCGNNVILVGMSAWLVTAALATALSHGTNGDPQRRGCGSNRQRLPGN